MCGRYNITTDPESWRAVFDVMSPVGSTWGDFEPRYNIAPSEPPLPVGTRRKAPRRITQVPVVRQTREGPVADNVIWPLVPAWAKGEVPKYSTANARFENMREKNSYRRAWTRGQRCLIYATGFYEWQAVEDQTSKQPWVIGLQNSPHVILGGLWETSWTPKGETVHSCTIVTLGANELMRDIHNAGKNRHRMPLILPEDHWETWLAATPAEAWDLIQPYPADEMRARPVSHAINNPNLDEPQVLDAIED